MQREEEKGERAGLFGVNEKERTEKGKYLLKLHQSHIVESIKKYSAFNR